MKDTIGEHAPQPRVLVQATLFIGSPGARGSYTTSRTVTVRMDKRPSNAAMGRLFEKLRQAAAEWHAEETKSVSMIVV